MIRMHSTLPAPALQQPLSTLAAEINRHHRAAESSIRSGLEHALQAGRLLLAVKAQCRRGKWADWLKTNCECSQRTAQSYIRIAKRWPEIEAKAQHVALLSFRDAVKMLAAPRDVPEQNPTEEDLVSRLAHLPEGCGLKGERWQAGTLDLVVLYPSERHPGFYWVAAYLDFNHETARAEYFRRPVRGEVVGETVQFLLHSDKPCVKWDTMVEGAAHLADLGHSEYRGSR